jgi:hypothetical protein
MGGASELALRALGPALLVALLLTSWWARSDDARWGTEWRSARLVRAGPYRSSILGRPIPRAPPARVVVVGGLGIAWGLITSVILAPAALLFLTAPLRANSSAAGIAPTSVIGAIAAALGALALGGCLIAVSRALLRREHDVLDRACLVAAWSSIHHASVLGAFALFAIHEGCPGIAALVSIPCGLGVLHAVALVLAARSATAASERDEIIARCGPGDARGPRSFERSWGS